VNAVTVEAFSSSLGQLHVLLATVLINRESNLQMHAGNDLGVGQLPHVYVMATDNTGKTLDILTYILDTDILGGGLQ
jgi:hypothetical protein